jgi:hypothetical protein
MGMDKILEMDYLRRKLNDKYRELIIAHSFTSVKTMVAHLRKIQMEYDSMGKGTKNTESKSNDKNSMSKDNDDRTIDSTFVEKANRAIQNDYDWSKMPMQYKDLTVDEAKRIGTNGCFVCRTSDHTRGMTKCPHNRQSKSAQQKARNASMMFINTAVPSTPQGQQTTDRAKLERTPKN